MGQNRADYYSEQIKKILTLAVSFLSALWTGVQRRLIITGISIYRCYYHFNLSTAFFRMILPSINAQEPRNHQQGTVLSWARNCWNTEYSQEFHIFMDWEASEARMKLQHKNPHLQAGLMCVSDHIKPSEKRFMVRWDKDCATMSRGTEEHCFSCEACWW